MVGIYPSFIIFSLKGAMFNKQLEKINSLLNTIKQESAYTTDSIGLISNNISRPKTQSKLTSSRLKTKPQNEIVLVKEGIPKKYTAILEHLFR
jgi:hypothetical protein